MNNFTAKDPSPVEKDTSECQTSAVFSLLFHVGYLLGLCFKFARSFFFILMMIKNSKTVKPKICTVLAHQETGYGSVLRRRSDDDMKEEIEVEDMYNKYA